MNILISNDDGYLAPGIASLSDALSEIASVVAVAPDRNRSGASSSLTLTQPINTRKHSDTLFSVEGTPADCVGVALGGLCEQTFDMVVSGINDGPNMADDVLYSGTIAAAIEGRFLKYPSIAISMATFHPQHFETAASVACDLVLHLQNSPMPQNTILNVNVPDVPRAEILAIESTRLGTRDVPAFAGKHENPKQQPMFWLGPAGEPLDNAQGTDFHAVANNKVSVTPLTIDMTRHDSLQSTQQWLNTLEMVS